MSKVADTEITLKKGIFRAVVAPFGASLRRFFTVAGDGTETAVAWGYSGSQNKIAGQGDVLIPFPGRIRNATYQFLGKTYSMQANDKESPGAIHGFLRRVTWEVLDQTTSKVSFSFILTAAEYGALGYPFSLKCRVDYELVEEGLVGSVYVTNIGESAAPVGVGFHPYFQVGTEAIDEAEVCIPASHALEFDSQMAPTGALLAISGGSADFRKPRKIGTVSINTCFANLVRDTDGKARTLLRNPVTGRSIEVWQDPAFTHLVVYTGDAIGAPHGRRSLAIEPMTCATDHFNHPEWGSIALPAGEVLEASWGVKVNW